MKYEIFVEVSMAIIRFVHLSDTHILRDYSGSMIEGLTGNLGKTPVEFLRQAAISAKAIWPDLDFVVISGDLVHEGKAEDYAFFKQLLREAFGETPVYLALGNHDCRSAFREGYLGEAGNVTPYDYAVYHGGTALRLIVLDSSYDKSIKGGLEKEQFDWLRCVLKEDAKMGSILVIHHPPVTDTDDPIIAAHGLEHARQLHEAVKGSDIIAILSGHTHQVSATVFGGIPHYTADSTAFGVTVDTQFMTFNDRVGFVCCTVENRRLAANHVAFSNEIAASYSISISELIKMMQTQSEGKE